MPLKVQPLTHSLILKHHSTYCSDFDRRTNHTKRRLREDWLNCRCLDQWPALRRNLDQFFVHPPHKPAYNIASFASSSQQEELSNFHLHLLEKLAVDLLADQAAHRKHNHVVSILRLCRSHCRNCTLIHATLKIITNFVFLSLLHNLITFTLN